MTGKFEHLADWLRDAHALEEQIETLLKGQAERVDQYPDLKLRLQTHLENKQKHQVTINNCIQRLGEDKSTIKDMAAKVMATGQNLVGTTMSDEVIKGAMTLYVFTHTAISSYAVIIAAAEACGNVETANACKYLLEDEVAMSTWLLGHLPALTHSFLNRCESGSEAGN